MRRRGGGQTDVDKKGRGVKWILAERGRGGKQGNLELIGKGKRAPFVF